MKARNMDKFKPIFINEVRLELYSDDEFRLDVSLGHEFVTLDKKETEKLFNYLKNILNDNRRKNRIL